MVTHFGGFAKVIVQQKKIDSYDLNTVALVLVKSCIIIQDFRPEIVKKTNKIPQYSHLLTQPWITFMGHRLRREAILYNSFISYMLNSNRKFHSWFTWNNLKGAVTCWKALTGHFIRYSYFNSCECKAWIV